MNKIQDAFSQIRAEDALKQKTMAALRSKRHTRPALPRLAAAVCVLMLMLLAGGSAAWLVPVSAISIDINPSVQLSLNLFNRVVSTQAGNEDGALALDGLDLQFEPYEQAVETLLSCESLARFQQTDELLQVTVVSKQADQLTAGVQQCPSYALYQGSCQTASQDTLQAAEEAGLSVGRYLAYLELSALDPSITPEDCQKMTMREIRDRIVAAGGETGGPGSGNQNGQGAGNQNGQGAGYQNGQGAGNQNGQGAGNQNGQGTGYQNGQGAGNQNGQGAGSQNGQGAGHQYGKTTP